MIVIRPNALYTRQELRAKLARYGMSVDKFISKIKPLKRFSRLYWGADLIQAIDRLGALDPRLPSTAALKGAARKPRAARRASAPRLVRMENIKALMNGTKEMG
jgi:hypothetical protein